MNRIQKKLLNTQRRKHSIRAKVSGSALRPRLSVSISNYHVAAQLIDDDAHHTLVSVTTVGHDGVYKGTMTEKAAAIGAEIAKLAKKKKITTIVFDRNGKLYHGRVKALAEAARAEGLEF
jgi:large subunit ribosomal protein L18